MDPQHAQHAQHSQSQSQYFNSLNLTDLTLQDDWMFSFSSACESSLSQPPDQISNGCNQTVESYKKWTTFPNHADSWSLQPVVDQQSKYKASYIPTSSNTKSCLGSRNILEETLASTMEDPVDNSPRAISIPQSRESNRMRAESPQSFFCLWVQTLTQ
jgi:hypothetical protein